MINMQFPVSNSPHIPVLIEPIINLISPVSGCWLDGTFGAGGYTRALLEAGAEKVISIDRDPQVFDLAKTWVSNYSDKIELHNDKFSNLGKYGSDSYRLFFKKELPEDVGDHELKRYVKEEFRIP